jgi:hypothetical protein
LRALAPRLDYSSHAQWNIDSMNGGFSGSRHEPPAQITVGQYSDKGRKEINQDFHGVCVPREPQLGSKGIAIALADGISSSDVSQEAAQSAVSAFLDDYYCTSDAWSVKKSAEHVLTATNSWLHSQTQQSQHRYDRERGYVCTFSGWSSSPPRRTCSTLAMRASTACAVERRSNN